MSAGKVSGLVKLDSRKGAGGIPCGESFIPKGRKCTKPASVRASVTTPTRGQGNTGLLVSTAGILTVSAVLGVLARDVYSSGVDEKDIPPKKAPEGLYDTFQPGDLIYNVNRFAEANRAHYAVYAGKRDNTHLIFDVSLSTTKRGIASVARLRPLERAQDEFGTSFALAQRVDSTSKPPTREQLYDIIKQLNRKSFQWNGFENNCESFARAVANDIPVSVQGQKVSGLTNAITKAIVQQFAPAGFHDKATSLRYVRQVSRAAVTPRQLAAARRARGFGRTDSPWAVGFDAEDGKKYTKVVTNPETGRKNRIRYGAKGYKIAPGTDKGDRYCARSFGDMKSHGKDCSGADRNTPLCLSRAKWKCSGESSRRDGALTPGKSLA